MGGSAFKWGQDSILTNSGEYGRDGQRPARGWKRKAHGLNWIDRQLNLTPLLDRADSQITPHSSAEYRIVCIDLLNRSGLT
jgi:hypothetical protein